MYWVDIKLEQKKGLKFYQTRSNAIILYNTLTAFCFPDSHHDEIWRGHARESICVTSISYFFLRHWMEEFGSEVAGGGEDSRQAQPKTKNYLIK